jgi:hypothetical protein
MDDKCLEVIEFTKAEGMMGSRPQMDRLEKEIRHKHRMRMILQPDYLPDLMPKHGSV